MATLASSSTLTTKDARVLSAVFDPEAASDTPSKQSNQSSTDHPGKSSPYPNIPDQALPEISTAERAALLPLKISPHPSIEVISTTLSSLSNLIARFPSYPPAYVNRAQARRMLWQMTSQNNTLEDSTNDETHRNDITEAFENFTTDVFADLDEAIRLISSTISDIDGDKSINNVEAKPVTMQNISQEQARILGIAKCHRGYTLLQLAARAPATPYETESSQSSQSRHHLQALSKAQLEEMASHDFAVAGRYGDKTAREAAVALNPYARMCGAIVKNAMKEDFNFSCETLR